MKKFLKKNIIIKMVAIVLVAATVMGIAWNESFVKTKASGKVRTENVVTRGDEDEEEIEESEIVSSEVEELGENHVLVTIIRENGEKTVTEITLEYTKTTTYDSNGSIISEDVIDNQSFSNEDESNSINDDEDSLIEVDEDDDEDDEITRGKKYSWSWGDTHYDSLRAINCYWYKEGVRTNNETKKKTDFMRIGCESRYEINISKLNGTQQGKCQKYADLIDSQATHKLHMCKDLAAVGIGLAVVLGLIYSGVTDRTVLENTLAKLGAGAAAGDIAYQATEMWSDYQKMRSTYKVIRNYGKKYK